MVSGRRARPQPLVSLASSLVPAPRARRSRWRRTSAPAAGSAATRRRARPAPPAPSRDASRPCARSARARRAAARPRDGPCRNSSSASCSARAALGRAQLGLQRIERLQPQDAAAHRGRRDRAATARCSETESCVGRASSGGRGSGRGHGLYVSRIDRAPRPRRRSVRRPRWMYSGGGTGAAGS